MDPGRAPSLELLTSKGWDRSSPVRESEFCDALQVGAQTDFELNSHVTVNDSSRTGKQNMDETTKTTHINQVNSTIPGQWQLQLQQRKQLWRSLC